MTAIFRNESRRLRRSSLILTGVFSMVTAFFLAVFPAMKEEAELIQEAYPDYILVFMGIEELHTIEGFTAGYIYPFMVILFGGIYFAYLGAGLIASDVESRRMDLTLSNPVSRESVLFQKVASLWVPMVLINLGIMAVIGGGAMVLNESLDLYSLALLHLLVVPYLLVCAGIGLLFSVVFDSVSRAQVSALGVVFSLWMVDGAAEMQPDYEWLGELTPSRYFDPNAILVHEEYAIMDATILLLAFFVLVSVATLVFIRRDI